MVNSKKTIIITGASSGLGRALAKEYATAGNCRLFLFGRNKERLDATGQLCNYPNVDVELICCRLEDKAQMKQAIEKIIAEHSIDIVIACAGVSAGTLDGPETSRQVEKIFAVNVGGVLNTIVPCFSEMIARQKGDIVIISSMAGIIGLASSPSYSASKGAVRLFGEALRGYMHKHHVNVTVALPGFIKTPMTEVNNFPMPFMTTPKVAARKIIKGINRQKAIIAFPLVMYIFMKMLTIMPNFIVNYVNSKLPGKPAFDD